MVDSEKNSCVRDAWSWGRCGFRGEPGVGGLGRREGVERVWNRRIGWGVGGGQLCTQQVTVQCVVRVAAKHWASGLQGWGGR